METDDQKKEKQGEEAAPELTPTEQAAKEYEEAWEDIEAGKEKPAGEEEGAGEETEEQRQARITAEEEAARKEAESKDPEHGDIASMRKALDDTKRFNTELSEKNKALATELEKAKKGEGDPAALEKAREGVRDIASKLEAAKGKIPALEEDYPEVAGAYKDILDVAQSLQDVVVQMKAAPAAPAGPSEEERQKALDDYRTNIKPKVMEVHKDLDEIVKPDSGYWAWADKQRPALKFAALHSSDPEDIVEAINTYKRDLARANSSDIKKAEEEARKRRIKDAAGLRGGRSTNPVGPVKGKEPDKTDYDGGWDEAEKLAAGKKG